MGFAAQANLPSAVFGMGRYPGSNRGISILGSGG